MGEEVKKKDKDTAGGERKKCIKEEDCESKNGKTVRYTDTQAYPCTKRGNNSRNLQRHFGGLTNKPK